MFRAAEFANVFQLILEQLFGIINVRARAPEKM